MIVLKVPTSWKPMQAENTSFPAFDWSKVSDEIKFSEKGLPFLSNSVIPPGDPDIENQISSPEHPWAITFFRQFHVPMIQSAGVELAGCRILELGSGFGRLAYGTLKAIKPDLYIATDVFPQLVSVLSGNLPKWTTAAAAAAFLDPQDTLLFKPQVFNVIQSHSVLHHVLDYRAAVRALYDRLATPGVLIFCEPCLEGYLFFLTTVRMFMKSEPIPENLAKQISSVETFILQRTGPQRRNSEFLRGCGTGDKYIYSAYDLMELAEDVGAKLYIQNDDRALKDNLMFELRLRGADEDTLGRFDTFLSDLLPEGVENAYFSDLRQVFSLRKG
jgi:SAM-dependent methyltransferase